MIFTLEYMKPHKDMLGSSPPSALLFKNTKYLLAFGRVVYQYLVIYRGYTATILGEKHLRGKS
jgi:hypothetical protein